MDPLERALCEVREALGEPDMPEDTSRDNLAGLNVDVHLTQHRASGPDEGTITMSDDRGFFLEGTEPRTGLFFVPWSNVLWLKLLSE